LLLDDEYVSRAYLWREMFLKGKETIGGNEAWFQYNFSGENETAGQVDH